jgi:IS30 family transposase
LIRQYIPKNSDPDAITNADLIWIMTRLNHRPRKCLDFLSPFEVFFDQSVALTS